MSKCENCAHKENFYSCDLCIHSSELTDMFEPMTNADRIRAMSDEELAAWISSMSNEGACMDLRIPLIREKCDGQCGVCCLAWLKQPAEEA